jgi:adenylate cyclase
VIDVGPVVAWLDEGAPGASTPEALLAGLSRHIVAQGIALARMAIFVRTLHPNFVGRRLLWQAERPEEVQTTSAEHDWLKSDAHLHSPIYAIAETGRELRRRLADGPVDFPVLAELRAAGLTDFYAAPLPTMAGERLLITFGTRQPGGFAEEELSALRRLLPPIARVAEIATLARKARNILNAYLGEQAGEKVLAGQIRRGDGEEIRAVIWFCDLRDSTPLADAMGARGFLRLLNEYFEAVLGPVLERKGEVLRFIGDAALAIFPLQDLPEAACKTALEAAVDALARMEKLNAARERPLGFGIGLHLGEVLYGNVGTASRIEFTVVGAAANEAARIEALCKELGTPLVLSAAVAGHLSCPLRSLGRHRLRGVGESVELFTLLKST